MTNQSGKTRNGVVRLVALAAIVLGAAGMAGAKPPKWKFFPKKWYPKKWYPKKGPYVHWNLKIVRPAPIVQPAPVRPIVVAPTVVEAPARPAAEELKGEIAQLKARYAKMAQTREDLQKWLAGPGKHRSETERTNVQTRLAKVDRQCSLLATRIAELEQTLAEM